MEQELPLFPEAASQIAPQVDALFFAWSAISLFFTALIAVLILYFMVRYRRRGIDEVGQPERAPYWLEIGWSIVPLVIALAMFFWGARVFYNIYRPPANAVEYWTVGKQWMWKFQHPDGHREINTLHIPVGQPIKLNIQSEDVIHSFFVPAFRVKQDAVPGRMTQVFFEATKPGVYHLFCTEYCGGEHSKMIGSVIALEPEQYEAWLAGGPAGKSMVASGAELFQSLACDTCHREASGGVVARAPRLEGLYQNQVRLLDGRTILADDEYIRESILNPAAKIVAGWQPIMPTYQGQVTEEQLAQLISYVRSLGGPEGGSPEAGGGSNTAGDVAGGQRDSDQPQTAGPTQPDDQPEGQ